VAALAACGASPVVVAHELTDETRPLLLSGSLDALIVQDPGHEARSAVRVLMAALTGGPISEDQERIRIEILLPDNLPK
jgi:LacI family transcriptional regulator